jgi:type II secretory pathway pseudopilin PulG
MMNQAPIRRRPAEEGYILIWVIFLLVIFSISLSIAVPAISKEIERDRERETMERGKQYRRAVQLYYKKFHAYPPNVNALVNTNDIRFLRKKYVDPMTGKDDWKPILFGQAKTPTLGFFGQPLAGGGTTVAGIGPSGGSGLGSGSGIGGSGFGSSNSSIGSSDTSGTGMGGTGSGGATDSSGNQSSGSGGTGGTGASGTSSGSSSGTSGQTFGGAGIVGFSPGSTKASILTYKKKNHFNEWEFVYDPLADMKTQSGNTGNIGQPASSTTTPVGGSSFGTPTTSPVSPPASTPETTPQ